MTTDMVRNLLLQCKITIKLLTIVKYTHIYYFIFAVYNTFHYFCELKEDCSGIHPL